MSLYRISFDCVCVCVLPNPCVKLAVSACVTIPAYGVCVCVVLGFCPVALLKFWSTAVSGPGTPLTDPDDCQKSGYEGVRDNHDFGQALLVA